ncbi:MAG: N-acetylglucosamine-6-phosphate deacetylase [Psychrilyobacter sp.]|uniref:N-acetylglucosamine-6-phosphate deacetylase n=1 Tax=Psychrilyobacter sp. TaxID=2586924 RepID=UPI003C780846
MVYALTNGKIFTGEKSIFRKSLIIEGKKIKDIIDEKKLAILYPNIEIKDVKGRLIAPAFIDLQLNGCGGVLVNDDISEKTFKIINETNLKYGCTMYTPTLITCEDEKIEKSLEVMSKIENLEDLGIIGLHIEGPYISKEKKGTHREDYIRILSDEIIEKISNSKTTILTLAPENATTTHINKLVSGGITVSMGHTNGTYDEISNKLPYGITMATHLYNGMSSYNHREPGAVGAILNSKKLTAGIIVDGLHCHYAAVKIAKKLLGDRLFLVTDAAAPAGTDMKEFLFEGKRCFHSNGELRNEEGSLAGSVLTMIKGVQNLVEYVGESLEESLRMASLYPAKAIGIDDRYGKIKKGYIADLVILDEKINLKNVIVKGRWRY